MNNKTLFLPLKAKWYDMIESGIKTEEYREFKEYWFKRLANKKYKYVRFSYGYTRRTMTFEIEDLGWDIGRPEWGAIPGKVCFVIRLGRRLK